jgi:hypothetical protein
MAAFSADPVDWLGANYTADSTTMTITLADLEGLTEAEAAASTGDIRDIMLSLLKTLATQWATMSAAEQPSYFKIYPSASTNATTGEITRSYTIQLTTAVSGEDVKDEPA